MEPPESNHQSLKVGDRVRLTSKYHGARFRPGNAGTIVAVLPASAPKGTKVYQVRLDEGEATLYPAFYEEEVERL